MGENETATDLPSNGWRFEALDPDGGGEEEECHGRGATPGSLYNGFSTSSVLASTPTHLTWERRRIIIPCDTQSLLE